MLRFRRIAGASLDPFETTFWAEAPRISRGVDTTDRSVQPMLSNKHSSTIGQRRPR